jgi:hypothetical protein
VPSRSTGPDHPRQVIIRAPCVRPDLLACADPCADAAIPLRHRPPPAYRRACDVVHGHGAPCPRHRRRRGAGTR